MNIFVLDTDPKIAAQYHCDKHVVKMILETAQLLCTAHHVNGINANVEDYLYKQTHINHPCAIWARQSKENYDWLTELGLRLCKEYTKRYDKVHKSQYLIQLLTVHDPIDYPKKGLTEFAIAMPEEYRLNEVVSSYRNYYKYGKKDILTYKNSEIPEFLK